MKITVEKGMNVQSALDSIKDFLAEQFLEYPNLKGNLNLYLTLQDGNGDVCPKNEREYEIYSDRIVDVMETAKTETYSETINSLRAYLRYELHKKERVLHDISVAENYIATAEEKGRKPENIAKRKNDLVKYKEKLEYVERGVKLYSLLNSLYEQNKFKVLFTQHKSRRKYGSCVEYECALIFIGNGEIEGYFECNNGFSKDIPEEYRRLFTRKETK